MCIVESWLCVGIDNNEISLQNYSIIRLDRDRHGGGILLYIRDGLSFENVQCGPDGLKIIFVSIFVCSKKGVCLGIFYRPPSSSNCIFYHLFDVICSLNVSFLSDLILLGDFNVDMLSYSPLCNHLINLQNTFSLTPVDKEPTRIIPIGSAILIDLVVLSDPQLLHECKTIPQLGNSDHLGISLQVHCYSDTPRL